MTTPLNQGAPMSRRPAGQSDGSDNLSAMVAADRAFPAAVAELGSLPLRTFMKAIIGSLLCCLSAFAADTNEIRVVTRTDTKVSPGYLVTYEEFTRNGQTNLLRITSVKDGVTNSIAHNFYHRGAYLGRYSQGGGYTFVNTAPSAPCALSFVWDSSNQIRTASVTTTNHVTLDSFTCTNGIFYPVASLVIEESNRKTKDILHH